MKEITLYAAIAATGDISELFQIKLFCDAVGTEPTDGDITVPKEGAIVRFVKLPGQAPLPWRFHDLTIHPMGPETDRLHLSWRVGPNDIYLKHMEAHVKKRYYSYTLSIEFAGNIYYLDPQLVDVGDGTR